MTYSFITRGDFRAQLATRLQDPEMRFWVAEELNAYINEALQLLGVAGLYFRERVTQTAAQGVTFYDIADCVAGDGSFPLTRTTTDQQLVNQLQRHLQEPVNDFSVSAAYAGTEMFTMDAFQNALERRLNRYLFDTHLLVIEQQQNVTTGNGRVPLPGEVVDIVRAAWSVLDTDGNPTATRRLWRTDEAVAARQAPQWTVRSGKPTSYSLVVEPATQIQLIPAPNDGGRLELLTVVASVSLDVTNGIILNLPNDLCQFIKWGAMADLLGHDGQARDPQRSDYCEKRYQEGVQLGKLYTHALNAELNGLPLQMSSVTALDAHTPRWQETQGRPRTYGMAGVNLLALSPPPDTNYGIGMDVVRNAVLPTADGDFLQIGQDAQDPLLDYCEHLAMFKCGGAEWEATLPHYQRFMSFCADSNSRLKASAEMFEVLVGNAQMQAKAEPLRASA